MAAFLRLVAVFAIASPIATIAQAADLPPMPMPPPIQRATIDDAFGWYLRGDVGYRWNSIGGTSTTGPFNAPGDNVLKSGGTLGGGFGYKWSWIRGDLTFDYGFPVRYTGTSLTAGDTTAKISSMAALANFYFDLGTWSGMTPYLGAGLGGGNLLVSNYSSTGAPPFVNQSSVSRWNFAWAAMAGVSYAFTPNVAADFGYRYLSLGHAQTSSDASGRTTFNNIRGHELKLGLRWMFGPLF